MFSPFGTGPANGTRVVFRNALAIFLVIHAAAHAYGFASSFRLLSEVRYKTTLFGGRIDVGDRGARLVGVAWLLLSLAFGAASFGLVIGAPWWTSLTLVSAVASIGLCIADLPAAPVGVLINVLLVVTLFFETWMAWLASM